MQNPKSLASLTIALALFTTVGHSQGLRVQDFDSEVSAQSDGWYEYNSRSEGRNNFGFTNRTDFGTWTTAGEAGSFFSRCTNTCFYGTTNLGALFSLTDSLHAEGKLAIMDFGSLADTVVYFAFFNTAQLGLPSAKSACGMTVQEPHAGVDTQALRCKPTVLLADGTRIDPPIDSGQTQPKTATFAKRGLYRWSYDCLPQGNGNAVMTFTMWTNGAVNPIRTPMTCTVSAANIEAQGPVFDAFGVYVIGSGPGDYQGTNVNNWLRIAVDEVRFTDSHTLPCIQLAPSGIVVAAGQTNRTVTMSIPPQLNLAQTASITVVSANPSVAVPTGGSGGVLTLNFPAGTTNEQTFDVTGVAAGTTFFTVTNGYGVCVANSLNVLVPAAPQVTLVETQVFNSASSALAAGWVENLSRTNGDNFGFNNSNFATGAGAGEAGGVFASFTNKAYYADVFTPALTLNDNISASGKVVVRVNPTTNNTIRVGHLLSTGAKNASMIGFDIAEPDATFPDYARVRGLIQGADGSLTLSSILLRLSAGTVWNWSYSYDPSNNGRLTTVFDDGAGTTVSNAINLSFQQRMAGASVDSFGLIHGAVTTNNTDIAEVYIDDVVYTVKPQPIQITRIENLGATLRLTFTTPQPGLAHEVLQSENLTSSWSTVTGVTFGGPTGNQITAQFTKPAGTTMFYRVRM